MDIVSSFQKKIVTSKSLIVLAIFLALIMRGALFVFCNEFIFDDSHAGFLSKLIFTYITSYSVLSLCISLLFTFLIAVYADYINVKYNLIRIRTYLLYSFIILIFSTHPIFLSMSPYYVLVLLFLLCIDILFKTYQNPLASNQAFSIGFIIAIGSLFSIFFLPYILLFFIGLLLMRSFHLKIFLAAILGLLIVYWLVFFFYLGLDNIAGFLNLFSPLFSHSQYQIDSLLSIKTILFGLNILLLAIIIIYSLVFSYEDKIRIRAMIRFFEVTILFTFLSFFLINQDPIIYFFIYAISCSIILSHFFAVSSAKWQIVLYYLCAFSIFMSSLSYIYFLN